MKICILAPRFPFPEHAGDVLRINNIARYLKGKGHELILVSFLEPGSDMQKAKELYNNIYVIKRNPLVSAFNSLRFFLQGKPIQCGYYYSSRLSKIFQEIIQRDQPDLYVSHLLRMTSYLEENKLQEKSIVEMTDALSKSYTLSAQAYGSTLKKLIYKIEKHLIQKYEQKVINTFPKVVLVSKEDIDLLNQGKPHRESLAFHTNGVEICKTNCKNYDCNKIAYIGNMRSLQNQDAVIHFIKDIFPKILSVNPDAKFHIIGAQPSANIKALATNSVIISGFVENLEDTVSNCCLVVAPIRMATGIQNKVLVAMGCHLPVVMTSPISVPIPELEHNANCIIHDDDSEFAEACLKLMHDPNLRNRIGEAGYEMVKKSYSWASKLEGYEIL